MFFKKANKCFFKKISITFEFSAMNKIRIFPLENKWNKISNLSPKSEFSRNKYQLGPTKAAVLQTWGKVQDNKQNLVKDPKSGLRKQ